MVRTFDTPIFTSDQSVDRVLATGLPVALIFVEGKAPAEIEQTLNRMAKENAGQLLIAQLAIKDNVATARRYGLTRAPGVVTVKQGEVLSKSEGASAADVQHHILYLLGKGPKPASTPNAQSGTATAHAGSPAGRSADGHAAQAGSTQHGSSPQHVTDATFERDVLRSPLPVLVDFWAPWCGPCRSMEPAIERLAHSSPNLRVAKVNVDENPVVAQQFGIQSIPTMMVVKNGQVVDRWVGAQPEGAIRGRLARWL